MGLKDLLLEPLKKTEEITEKLTEPLLKPIEDLAARAGLPTPPRPPRLSEVLEQLPEPPVPSLPGLGQSQAHTVAMAEHVETGVSTIEVTPVVYTSTEKPKETPAKEANLGDEFVVI